MNILISILTDILFKIYLGRSLLLPLSSKLLSIKMQLYLFDAMLFYLFYPIICHALLSIRYYYICFQSLK